MAVSQTPSRWNWFRKDQKVVEDDDEIEVAIPPMKWRSQTPEMDSNIFSGLLFLWLQPLFTRASFLQRSGRALEVDDLPPLPSIDLSKVPTCLQHLPAKVQNKRCQGVVNFNCTNTYKWYCQWWSCKCRRQGRVRSSVSSLSSRYLQAATHHRRHYQVLQHCLAIHVSHLAESNPHILPTISGWSYSCRCSKCYPLPRILALLPTLLLYCMQSYYRISVFSQG